MKFTANAAEIASAADAVQRAAGPRLDIVAGVLVSCSKGSVTLTCTDLDQELACSCAVGNATDGEAIVNAQRFARVLGQLPKDQEVSFELRQGMLAVKCRLSRYKFASFDVTFWPAMETRPIDTRMTLGAAALDALIGQVHRSAGKDDVRHSLNGVHFEAKEGDPALAAVGTDGHRFAMAHAELPEPVQRDIHWTVPQQAAANLRRLLGQAGEADVSLGIAENLMVVEAPGAVLKLRLLDDTQYPSWRRIIPEPEGYASAAVDAKDLRAAIARVALTADAVDKIDLEFSPPQGHQEAMVALKSSNSSGDSGLDSVGIAYFGPVRELTARGKYLIDAIDSLGVDIVAIKVRDESSAILLEPATTDSLQRLQVVMPMLR